ncbi:MAG: tetratricopeptide repeat protein [Candidatus Wallbacteria bacterium]|nr:tetratricopeptide repeat protein [Candidatus Wallbacteria bacterium]
MRFLLLVIFALTLPLFCSENILTKIDFASEIFYPKLALPETRNPEEIYQSLLQIPEEAPKAEYLLKFFKKTGTEEIHQLYDIFLRKMEAGEQINTALFLLLKFELLPSRDEREKAEFSWQIVNYSLINQDNPWAHFITACLLFSLQEEAGRQKAGPEPEEPKPAGKLDPYAAMEKAIMLSSSPQVHYLIAQIFRQLAYTNVNAHKIIILELSKAEAILKVQNTESFKLFLGKEITLLKDFLELYKFYHTDPPFYLEEALYQKMMEADEKDGVAFNNMADLLVRYNTRMEEAQTMIDKALALCPSNASIIETKGYLFFRKSMNAEAEEWLLKSIALDDRLVVAHEHLAELYFSWNKLDQSLQQYEILLKLNPSNARYYNDLGYLLADNGIDLKRAVSLCQEALQLSPQNGAYLDSLAWASFKLGDMEQARKQIEQAMELEKEEPYIFYHAGEIYFSLQDLDHALEYYRQALKLKNDWDEVIRKLGTIMLFKDGKITREQLGDFMK